ncbi:MAG: winged helix-turn-helix domain-containing protein, partial [Nitrososphaerales archaeon]
MQRSRETSADLISNQTEISNVLNTSLYEKAKPRLKCPSCSADIGFFVVACPNCGSMEVKSGKVLEHLACKQYDFEESFKTRYDGVSCPKCGKSSQGRSIDFVSRGDHYKCLGCSAFVGEPHALFLCPSCGHSSEKDLGLPSFAGALNGPLRVSSVPYLDPGSASNLAPLIRNIKARGWFALPFKGLPGKSGIEHEFSLVVSDSPFGAEKSSHTHLIVAELVSSSQAVTRIQLLNFFAKALDAGVKNRILVAVPKLEADAKKFADSYGIATLEASTPDLALDMLLNKMSELIQKGGADRDVPEISKSSKRTSFDIIADILTIADKPISKTEILYRANLSFKQSERYLKMLEEMGLLKMYFEDGNTRRYVTTQKGMEYL